MIQGTILLMAVTGFGLAAMAEDGIPRVREERPRLVLRPKAWDGPSVERTKGWMSRQDYQDNLPRLKSDGVSGAYRYQVFGDEEAGKKCIAWLKGLKVPEKNPSDSPSYTGEALLYDAMVYDWMRNHPDFAKTEDRKAAVAYFEWWGELFKKHNSPGVVPFYSRNAGASLGLAAIAIALHGDSPKADDFLAHAYKDFTENIGTIRQMEDGATGGSSYGIIHEFQACANAAAAWRAGTDWDAAKWIKEKQGNWLERQMLYQIWAVYPNRWYWKEGDTWSAKDSNEHTLSLLAISDMYKNGFGRADLDAIRDGRIALACYQVNRLRTDGTAESVPAKGIVTMVGGKLPNDLEKDMGLVPRSAVLSPDAKTLYVTGFFRACLNVKARTQWVPGVGRIDLANGKTMEVFAGNLLLYFPKFLTMKPWK